jgi:hypothetical protein
MKTSQTLRIPLAALALLAASSAFAANRGSLHVSSPEYVAGKQLAAGDYSVRWEDRGASGVELTIMRGKQVVATAVADAVQLRKASTSDAVVIDTDNEERLRLAQIFFSGRSVAFELREPALDTNISSSGSSSQSIDPLPSGLQ